jgi:hypothetical protein
MKSAMLTRENDKHGIVSACTSSRSDSSDAYASNFSVTELRNLPLDFKRITTESQLLNAYLCTSFSTEKSRSIYGSKCLDFNDHYCKKNAATTYRDISGLRIA